MAPVIFGLDLAELQWRKFKSDYMWNNEYHLRRTKFIVYQCALIFCVVSESLGTDVLSDYIDEERYVQTRHPEARVHNNDYVGAGSYNIWAGVFIAFIFGAAFFFDLMWPERHESKSVKIAWKVCAVLSVVFHFSNALTLTIITARNSEYVTGVSQATANQYLSETPKTKEAPLIYRHNPRALAAVVFVWLGDVSVIASCILLFLSIRNTEIGGGPKSRHAQGREQAHHIANADPEARFMESEDKDEKSLELPERNQESQTDSSAERSQYTAPAAEHSGYNTQTGTVDAGATAAAQSAAEHAGER